MEARFIPITTTDALDDLITQSAHAPVLLFKHDPFCSISRRAYQEMAALPHDVALVNVARDTAVARYISLHTHVKHESPQVILLLHGAAVWSASHFAITRQAVDQAVQQVADGQTAA